MGGPRNKVAKEKGEMETVVHSVSSSYCSRNSRFLKLANKMGREYPGMFKEGRNGEVADAAWGRVKCFDGRRNSRREGKTFRPYRGTQQKKGAVNARPRRCSNPSVQARTNESFGPRLRRGGFNCGSILLVSLRLG